jgi:hypothetical protein
MWSTGTMWTISNIKFSSIQVSHKIVRMNWQTLHRPGRFVLAANYSVSMIHIWFKYNEDTWFLKMDSPILFNYVALTAMVIPCRMMWEIERRQLSRTIFQTNRSWPILRNSPEFAWMSWENLRKILVCPTAWRVFQIIELLIPFREMNHRSIRLVEGLPVLFIP